MTASKPTMADIARELGITSITVSRALSGSALVKDATRQKVREVAERLGYRLNVAARNLRQQRANAVAVVVEMTPTHERSLSEPCPLSLIGGIMDELAFARQNMVFTTSELFFESPPSVDGIILIGQGLLDAAEKRFADVGLPTVVWGAKHGPDPLPVVGSDNFAGGKLAAQHLLGKGRRRLAFIGNRQYREVDDRLRGFQAAIASGGFDVALQIVPAEFDNRSGYEAASSLLEIAPDVDGIFAASDIIALGAVQLLKEHGADIPDAISIVGFDNSPAASLNAPSLSSIDQDWDAGGKLLAQSILRLISGETVKSTMLPVALIERQT